MLSPVKLYFKGQIFFLLCELHLQFIYDKTVDIYLLL